MLPGRLLGLIGLYAMRELQPDYAIALTTQGGKDLSTLGRSKGTCDYSGIFANIGFQPSDNPHWLVSDDFDNGFYESLERANLRRNEVDLLNAAVTSINSSHPIIGTPLSIEPYSLPIHLCSDRSIPAFERDLALHYR